MAHERITMRHLRLAVEGAAIKSAAIDQVHREAAARADSETRSASMPADAGQVASDD